jgi:hypothetical protein
MPVAAIIACSCVASGGVDQRTVVRVDINAECDRRHCRQCRRDSSHCLAAAASARTAKAAVVVGVVAVFAPMADDNAVHICRI